MTPEEFERMQEYVARIGAANRCLAVLTPEELRDLDDLLLKRIAEVDFGFPSFPGDGFQR